MKHIVAWTLITAAWFAFLYVAAIVVTSYVFGPA